MQVARFVLAVTLIAVVVIAVVVPATLVGLTFAVPQISATTHPASRPVTAECVSPGASFSLRRGPPALA